MTEKCFQNGHLKFDGNSTWIYQKIHGAKDFWTYDWKNWKETNAVRTTLGTYPLGSEWAKINLPIRSTRAQSWAFMDLVKVPSDQELGHYVLSFRSSRTN